jgi:hypothetical protein
MNWKARALTSPDLTDAHVRSLVTRGKPVNYNEAISLVGMMLRARGDTAEGVTTTPPTPVKEAKAKLKDKKAKAAAADADTSGMVSNEDGTPWEKVLEQAKSDDRLSMAIKDGIVFPVKAGG